jgi:large subunit ribosomal protein L22
MEYRHVQKNIGHSPRKMRLVADSIRKMAPARAVERLVFVNKAAAADLAKVIKTALANVPAVDNANLRFKVLEVNEGMKMRRFRAGTKGRIKPYKKKTSHVRVVLTDEVISVQNKETRKEEVQVAK